MEDHEHGNPWFSHFDHESSSTTPGECPYSCPVCMGMSVVKQMRPEVAVHLAAAGREFFLAAKAFLDGMAEAANGQDGASAPKVEHIDLDG